MADLADDLDLLNALGVDTQPKKKAKLTAREERIIAGFEEIQRFVEQQGHVPQQGEDNDIFERLYAVRLAQILQQEDCRGLVTEQDYQGLLDNSHQQTQKNAYDLDDEALLAELGLPEPQQADITVLKHVRPRAQTRMVEEVAERTVCNDFADFQPLFERAERELQDGVRETLPFGKDASIEEGNFFILGGQMTYVAKVGDLIKAPNGEKDARLRTIYANGTESNILLRSLQRALYKDEMGRRITDSSMGPLFDKEVGDENLSSGTIYVLRSLSDHPTIAQNRDVIHKIGVTGGDIKARINDAKSDPTFLMADVKLVQRYTLVDIHRVKLENLLHRFFEEVRLDISIPDRFGKMVMPREWFLVPAFVITEAIARIEDGTLTNYKYDSDRACLVPI